MAEEARRQMLDLLLAQGLCVLENIARALKTSNIWIFPLEHTFGGGGEVVQPGIY